MPSSSINETTPQANWNHASHHLSALDFVLEVALAQPGIKQQPLGALPVGGHTQEALHKRPAGPLDGHVLEPTRGTLEATGLTGVIAHLGSLVEVESSRTLEPGGHSVRAGCVEATPSRVRHKASVGTS